MRKQTKLPGRPANWLEAGLWFAALCCGGWWAHGAVEARGAQTAADQIVVEAHPATTTVHAGELIGRLEMPALRLSVPLLENYDPGTLRRGVGHVPGTAVPGGLGNLVLAGHRDTFFRPLREVRPGMQAQIVTPAGKWRYVVDRTDIVNPDQVEVLDIGDRPEMTLITCYPFNYIGAAPQRFIVRAHLISVDAD